MDACTVKIMISLPFRYRPVTVPLPSRYRFWVSLNTVTSPLPHRYLTVTGVTDRYLTVTDRYSPLLTVTDRYSPLLTVTSPLLTVTDRYRYSPFFWKFNLLFIAVKIKFFS